MFESIVNFIVDRVGDYGYAGVFIMMFLESSFFPFPSEVVIIPAAYLAYQGEMNIYLVIFYGTVGSLAGALFNYYLALYFRETFLLKYGKYLLISEKTIKKMDRFFAHHGEISTFIGRLLPGIRQYISLPAGLSKMNIFKFSIYTTLGAGIWVSILAVVGYFIGNNQDLIKENLHEITIGLILFILIVVFFYAKLYVKRGKK